MDNKNRLNKDRSYKIVDSFTDLSVGYLIVELATGGFAWTTVGMDEFDDDFISETFATAERATMSAANDWINEEGDGNRCWVPELFAPAVGMWDDDNPQDIHEALQKFVSNL